MDVNEEDIAEPKPQGFIDESSYLELMKASGKNEEDLEVATAYSVETAVQTYMKELNKTIEANKSKQPAMNCECPEE